MPPPIMRRTTAVIRTMIPAILVFLETAVRTTPGMNPAAPIINKNIPVNILDSFMIKQFLLGN